MVKPAPLTFNDREFHKKLKRIEGSKREETARKVVEKVGKSIMRRSKKLTPVDEGDVRDSHRLDVTTEDGAAAATISVTDPAAYYVHEQLENRHDDGRAKFLRDAFRQRKSLFQRTLREEFSKLLRKEGLGK